MRLAAFCWASDVALLLQAARETSIHLQAWAISELNDENLQVCINSLNAAQAILLHPSRQDPFFDRVVERIDRKIPVISFGLDPSMWSFSTVSSKIVSTANAYLVYGGEENAANMIRYIGREVLGHDYSYEPPRERLWQGLYHPDSSEAFSTVADYLEWRGRRHEHCVGILFFRTYWSNGDLCIVDSLIRELEKDVDVLPAFCFGMGDRDLGAKSSGEVVEEYFLGRVDGVINLQSIFHAGSVEQSVPGAEATRSAGFPPPHRLPQERRRVARGCARPFQL